MADGSMFYLYPAATAASLATTGQVERNPRFYGSVREEGTDFDLHNLAGWPKDNDSLLVLVRLFL
jgi:hypothetical protein